MGVKISSLGRSGRAFAVLFLAVWGLSACALQEYEAQPLDPQRIITEFEARHLDDPGLHAFMERHGSSAVLPGGKWGLSELSLAAFYFNPRIAVARAEWKVQQAGEITAGQYNNPNVDLDTEYHKDDGYGPLPAWALGITFDISLEFPGKREARIDQAVALSKVARLGIAEQGWQVRTSLRQRFVDLYEAIATHRLTEAELEILEANVALLEKHHKAGQAGRFETSAARLRRHQAKLALDEALGNITTSRVALAGALGLPLEIVDGMALDFAALGLRPPSSLNRTDLRQMALFNRLDLRKGLAEYAVSEAALRREIKNQYPDLILSPGYLWDQGDLVWNIGVAFLFPFLNVNEGPIAEARASRELEAARFTALQTDVLGELSLARAGYAGVYRSLMTAESLLREQKEQVENMDNQFTLGIVDRLSLDNARIELIAVQRAYLNAQIKVYRAFGRLEDTIQKPLDESASLPDPTDEIMSDPAILQDSK
ncbi:MAG: TolC family protein [Rhodospirillaceae bacterium]|jgi:outer membrane protein, heavy metal efflux system|nr:TolC family protein [Rhodospirillaceae bacterium]MBT5658891.1 TolC family protein [Rhodospirillaceae bacterium]MBT5751555.1 TolC family protein [Rhodospirillaceae bacterium]